MADLEGTVNFSGGDLAGELGVVAIGGEKPFVIPITESRDGSGNLVYSTTVMFADIVDAYKAGKRILIRSRGFGGETDVEIVSATVTEVEESGVGGGPITTRISQLSMIEDMIPFFSYPKGGKGIAASVYEFSYGANGATVAKNSMNLASFDVVNASLSHVGMIIHSTTLDTMQKVIDVYGGTEWQKLEGVFLLGASENHKAGSTGGSEDAVLPAHRHLAAPFTGTAVGASISGIATGQPDLTKESIKYASGSNSVKAVTNVVLSTSGPTHTHSVNGTVQPTAINTSSTSALVVSEATGKNMPPYKTVYIWERTA